MSTQTSNPKVFTIGFNKTATTTLTKILQQYELKVTHDSTWETWINQKRFDKFEKYDAFTDGQQKDFRELDKMYPGSKFILNTRSLKGWLVSRWCHVQINKVTGQSTWIDNSDKAIQYWAYSRDNYHADVLQYFKNRPKDFIVLDVQKSTPEEINVSLTKLLQGVAKYYPDELYIPTYNGSNETLKEKAAMCVDNALKTLKLTEADKNCNLVTKLFKDDKYPVDIEKKFYLTVKTKKNIWYQPFEKKLKFKV